VLVLLVTGALFDSLDDLVTVALAAVGVAALAGWYQDKLARAEADQVEAARQRQQARETEEHDREQHERYLRELRSRSRLERAHKAERQWARELREQVSRLHQQQGPLGRGGDLREMVLQTAVQLTEAEKGLLLSREDRDGDGDFDLVCHVGFEHDPTHSAVAQDFARRVLRHDETVREDDSSELRGEGRNPADDEIHTLLAIPIYIREDFSGVVICANRPNGFEDLDDEVLLALGDHAGAVLENGRLHGELHSSYVATVRMLAEAIEAKDPSTRLHSEEVAEYVGSVAESLEIQPSRREELLIASLLHDVGKIGISERILLKPGRLTDDEFGVIKLHPRIGHRIVAGIPALAGIAPAILHHHERYDGSGYPSGLSGERIPLEARIVGVADSFSAMIADRPYSAGRTPEEACAELERCAGTQFDPEVVELFVAEVRAQPLSDAPPPDPALDSELAAHREDGRGPLGKPAYALVDNLTLLHSVPYLHERAEAEARGGRGCCLVIVDVSDLEQLNEREGFAAGDRRLVETATALRRVEAATGGVGCRLGGRTLALLVPGQFTGADELVRAEVGPGVGVTAVSWEAGESGYELVARAQRTVKLSRATGTTGRV
jgi:HD-GYP domain-containing protein (c-di-GMP phosphodiesterase class II)/GGDEF domain-containing protein